MKDVTFTPEMIAEATWTETGESMTVDQVRNLMPGLPRYCDLIEAIYRCSEAELLRAAGTESARQEIRDAIRNALPTVPLGVMFQYTRSEGSMIAVPLRTDRLIAVWLRRQAMEATA